MQILLLVSLRDQMGDFTVRSSPVLLSMRRKGSQSQFNVITLWSCTFPHGGETGAGPSATYCTTEKYSPQ